MAGHFEEVGLSMNLKNIVELGRPTFSEIVTRPLAWWLLYTFLIQIFLLWVVLKKEYREQNHGINIVEFVEIVEKVDENLTRGK